MDDEKVYFLLLDFCVPLLILIVFKSLFLLSISSLSNLLDIMLLYILIISVENSDSALISSNIVSTNKSL